MQWLSPASQPGIQTKPAQNSVICACKADVVVWRRSLPHASTGGKERGDASGENRQVALLRRDSSEVHEKTRPDDSCDSSVKAGVEREGGGEVGCAVGKESVVSADHVS